MTCEFQQGFRLSLFHDKGGASELVAHAWAGGVGPLPSQMPGVPEYQRLVMLFLLHIGKFSFATHLSAR